MKLFLIKIALFLSLFSGLYLVFFIMVDNGIKESKYQDFTEWNAIYSGDINADLLIMGSSRAWRQVDPKIMDSQLKVNSYNLGIDGYHIPMQLTKYHIYLEHNKAPRQVVYIVDHFSFDQRDDLFNKYQFSPYFNDTTLTNRLKEFEGYNWQHYHAPYFQYSGSKELCLAGIANFLGLKNFEANKYKGFRSKSQEWELDFDQEVKNNPKGKRAEVKAKVIKEFRTFLKNEKLKGIDIAVVYAPDYTEFQSYITNRDSVMDLYQAVCSEANIPFLDYSNHYLCSDKAYFYNPTHLNSKGAEIFTTDLSEKLRDLKND